MHRLQAIASVTGVTFKLGVFAQEDEEEVPLERFRMLVPRAGHIPGGFPEETNTKPAIAVCDIGTVSFSRL
jgi:hypothetical protein